MFFIEASRKFMFHFLHNKAAKLLKTIGARKESIDLIFKTVIQKFLSRGIVPLKKGLYLLVAIPAESEDCEDNKVLGASHHISSTKDDITT
jgi:hypothetical protein